MRTGRRESVNNVVRDDGVPPFYLVAGRNRLEAAVQLGLESIRAIEIPFGSPNGDDAALAEIAENLHRREISEIERAELLDRWIKHREAKRAEAKMPTPPEWLSDAWDQGAKEGGQVGQLKKPGKGRGSIGGLSQTSRELGVPRANLRRATKIAGLSDEAKAAAKDGGLDGNQSALLRAAKEPTPGAQVKEIERQIEQRAAANREASSSTLQHSAIAAKMAHFVGLYPT